LKKYLKTYGAFASWVDEVFFLNFSKNRG
jgi:hypothetical protein